MEVLDGCAENSNPDLPPLYLLTVVLSALREQLRTLRTFTGYCGTRLLSDRAENISRLISEIELVEEDFRSSIGLERNSRACEGKVFGGPVYRFGVESDSEGAGDQERQLLSVVNNNGAFPQVAHQSTTLYPLPSFVNGARFSSRASSPRPRRFMQTRRQTRRKSYQESSQLSDWYRVKKKNIPGGIRAKTRQGIARYSRSTNGAMPRTRKRNPDNVDAEISARREAEIQIALSNCKCAFLHRLPDLLKRTSSCFHSFSLALVPRSEGPSIKGEDDDTPAETCRIKCDSGGFEFLDSSNGTALKPIVSTLGLLHDKTHSLLSADRDTMRYDGAMDPPGSNTAEWLSQDDRYLSWRDGGQQNLLWLFGPAGSGKTLLSKSLSNHLDKTRQPFDIVATHFYDGPGEKASMSSILLSLVSQIVLPIGQTEDIPLRTLIDGSSGNVLENHDFGSIFKLIIELVASTTQLRLLLVLDGFEDNDEVASTTLAEILSAASSSQQVRCLVTSSSHPSVAMPQLAQASFLAIDLSEESQVQRQLFSFAQNCIETALPDNSQNPKRETFLRALSRKARSFLWIKLATEDLSKTIASNDTDLEAQIQTMPTDLEPLYRSRLERIRPGCLRIAKKVFSWIICAMRPLNIFEVLDALQLKTNFLTAPNIHNDSLGDPDKDPSRGLNFVCGGLVTVGENSKLQFIHSSVKNFLLSGALSGGSLARYSISWYQANENVARDCLDYLSRREKVSSSKAAALNARKSALEYIRNYWLKHYKIAEAYSQTLAGCLHRLLEDHKHRVLDWSNGIADEAIRGYMISVDTPLLFCASFGLEGLARMLLAAGNDPNAAFGGKTALHLAANNGHINIVRLLLGRGVDVEMEMFPEGRTAIELAQENGKVDIVNVLCNDGMGDALA